MSLTSLSSRAPSADATAIIAFKMRSALKFAARSDTFRSLSLFGANCAGAGPVCQAGSRAREIGIQTRGIWLYDARASAPPTAANYKSDAPQGHLRRRHEAP